VAGLEARPEMRTPASVIRGLGIRKSLTAVGVTVILALMIVGLQFQGAGSGQLSVPSVVGRTVNAAENMISMEGFRFQVLRGTPCRHRSVVVSQSPAPGMPANAGLLIDLVTS
jgi:hypothetical protein